MGAGLGLVIEMGQKTRCVCNEGVFTPTRCLGVIIGRPLGPGTRRSDAGVFGLAVILEARPYLPASCSHAYTLGHSIIRHGQDHTRLGVLVRSPLQI